MYECSFFLTSSPTFVVVCVLDGSHSHRSEAQSECAFDLHFLYGQGYWAFLHVSFVHLDFFLWKSSVQFICPFLCWVIKFWEFSFLNSLYILVTNPLSAVKLAKIFSHIVGYLFNLVTISLLCRSFLVSLSPICQSFPLVAELCWSSI
jgi:hypothetical protein